MKRLLLVALAIFCTNVVAQSPGDAYYHGTDSLVPLVIDSQSVLIKFSSEISQNQMIGFLQSFPRIMAPEPSDDTIDGFVRYGLTTPVQYWQFLDSLNDRPEITIAGPFYRFFDNNSAPIGQRLTVRFNDTVSDDSVQSIATQYGLTVDLELPDMPHVYVLRNASGTVDFTVDIANSLFDLPSTVYSHPTIGVYPTRAAYKAFDYYSSFQHHVKRVIGIFNSKSVWDFAGMTRSVTVAVLDDGVAQHEDLPSPKILQGIDFFSTTPGTIDFNPVPGDFAAHGQACAGIIAANHSIDSSEGLQMASGVISLSPRAKILPVKIFSFDGLRGLDHNWLANAISWAYQNGAEVLSNSWSYGHPYYDFPVLQDALERATLFGRNGRGCPVVFAAGNSAFANPQYPANLPYVLAVGATKFSNDSLWWFSSHGPELDVVAPSSDGISETVWGLDQMGALGRNPAEVSDCPPQSNNQNYDCQFGGTSAACPVVAGVASLLLAKDSTLSAQAVYYILKHSADTALAWGSITPPNVQYGYGVVNAFNAVLSISHGDLSNDNRIDLTDLSLLIGYMTLTPRPTIFPSTKLADMNCSGGIDISDLNWMIALVTSTPGSVPGPVKPCFKF